MIRFLKKRHLFEYWALAITKTDYKYLLWHILIYVCLLYNFHRYIFKYSHGGYPKEGYQQTPLLWQAGKFALVLFILSIIYYKSKFVNRIPIRLALIYLFLIFVLLINTVSILVYQQIATDEIEYLLFAFMLLPVGFLSSIELNNIKRSIKPFLNISQYIIIISNWIVIFNYFVFKIIPFHAYEGILLRFGGLWDDPNTLAIISCFFLGYAIFNKQYVFVVLHIINILLTISFNGYVLMFVAISYVFINTDKNRLFRSFFLIVIVGLLAIVAFLNFDLLLPIYEAKRESVEQHSTINVMFSWIPLLGPVQFHETWWISLAVNYFPLSIIIIIVCISVFVEVFLIKPKSLQGLLYILFFITNLFLPFLYMFPLNFIAIFFLVLYTKGIKF